MERFLQTFVATKVIEKIFGAIIHRLIRTQIDEPWDYPFLDKPVLDPTDNNIVLHQRIFDPKTPDLMFLALPSRLTVRTIPITCSAN